jgi:hypothetical protein
MSIDEEGLPQTREAAERIEQIEKQMEKEEKEFDLIEDKLNKAEKDLHRGAIIPGD